MAKVPVQVLGLILGIVGVALGSQLTVDGELLKAHKGIGIAAVVAVALQTVLAVSWRPPPKSAKRCAAHACVMARPTLLPCCKVPGLGVAASVNVHFSA